MNTVLDKQNPPFIFSHIIAVIRMMLEGASVQTKYVSYINRC